MKASATDASATNSAANNSTDIAIVGGGPVGAALALALHGSGLSVTVLEAREASVAAARDPRPIALSQGSRMLLERLDAWQGLAPTPIINVHVSQRGTPKTAALRSLTYMYRSAAVLGVPR